MEKEEILKIEGVNKSFGGIKAVDGVNIGFTEGKITALIGPNGAGKTTILNIINGFLKPDEGDIYLNGEKITHLLPWEISKKGIGRLFQDIRIFKKMSVIENVIVGEQNIGENPLNLFIKRKSVVMEEKKNCVKAKKNLEFVGLGDKTDLIADQLSYGQQKLLSIARLIMGNYKVLLLDEPASGIHPEMLKSLMELIKKIASEGTTIIFIEHNMNIVIELAHWVYFLDEGKVIGFGTPEEVLGNPEIRKSYLGI